MGGEAQPGRSRRRWQELLLTMLCSCGSSVFSTFLFPLIRGAPKQLLLFQKDSTCFCSDILHTDQVQPCRRSEDVLFWYFSFYLAEESSGSALLQMFDSCVAVFQIRKDEAGGEMRVFGFGVQCILRASADQKVERGCWKEPVFLWSGGMPRSCFQSPSPQYKPPNPSNDLSSSYPACSLASSLHLFILGSTRGRVRSFFGLCDEFIRQCV